MSTSNPTSERTYSRDSGLFNRYSKVAINDSLNLCICEEKSIIRATLCITYSQYSSQATHPPRASSVFLTMEQLTVLNYSPPPPDVMLVCQFIRGA